jgi:hypothetical protein
MTHPTRQNLDLGGSDPFSRYCREIAAFCPYLMPAIDAGVAFVRRVRVEGRTLEECHARLFETVVPVIEDLRVERRTVTKPAQALLLNENLVIDFPSQFDAHGKELLAWPVLALKHLYTSKSLLFGMFWKGEMGHSRCGIALPVPPVHFLSIRSAVKARGTDQRFFTANPHLLQPHIDAIDDGVDVFGAVCGTCVDINGSTAMRELGSYALVKAWVKSNPAIGCPLAT